MNGVRVTLLEAGSCTHPEHFVHRNGNFGALRFPATCALIEHPEQGPLLFDTGYTARFAEATHRFPARFYRWVTPVSIAPEQTAAAQLRARGIDPADVRTILVSHFHADHVGGLADFPNARFVFLERAWTGVRGLSGLGAVRRGFLPGLLPPDFERRGAPVDEARSVILGGEFAPFERGFDLFRDGTLVGVELPGHAPGQLGLVVRRADGPPLFLVADACWTSRCYRERIRPHVLTRLLFEDTRRYVETLDRIADLAGRAGDVVIVPSHCGEVRTSPLPQGNVETRSTGSSSPNASSRTRPTPGA
jgi:glyoxylase-like metal-dependent hydrolase (beta-lactamase superfamily II)